MRFIFVLAYLFFFLSAALTGAMFAPTLLKRMEKHLPLGISSLSFLVNLATLLLIFAAFWSLTGLFPWRLMAVLSAGAMLGSLIVVITGAAAGFGLPERQEKILALSLIWGSQRKVFGCITMLVGIFLLFASTIGSLRAYFAHPRGAPEAGAAIAFYTFTLMAIMSAPLTMAGVWPVVTSAYLDDDCRNSYMANSVSSVMWMSVYLLLPFLFYESQAAAALARYHIAEPPLWVVLAIPAALLLLGSTLPFFIGLYRYSSQSKAITGWETRWLRHAQQVVSLPTGPARTQGLGQLQQALQTEYQGILRIHQVQSFYEHMNALAPAEQPQQEPAPPANPSWIPDLMAQVQNTIASHADKLVEWDVRFGHAKRLTNYNELLGLALQNQDVKDSLQSMLDEATAADAETSSAKNVIASLLLTALPAVGAYLLKAFQPQFIELLKQLGASIR